MVWRSTSQSHRPGMGPNCVCYCNLPGCIAQPNESVQGAIQNKEHLIQKSISCASGINHSRDRGQSFTLCLTVLWMGRRLQIFDHRNRTGGTNDELHPSEESMVSVQKKGRSLIRNTKYTLRLPVDLTDSDRI